MKVKKNIFFISRFKFKPNTPERFATEKLPFQMTRSKQLIGSLKGEICDSLMTQVTQITIVYMLTYYILISQHL